MHVLWLLLASLWLLNPKVFGGVGYNWKTNNCTTYARDVWYWLSGEYFSSTGPFLVYDDPEALRDHIRFQQFQESMQTKEGSSQYYQRMNDYHYGQGDRGR